MADQAAVRRLALTFPEVEAAAEHFVFSVRGTAIAWVWQEVRELLTDAWRCRAPKRQVRQSGL